MKFYRDKIKVKSINSEKAIKEGGMTLDDDFTPFAAAVNSCPNHNMCLLVDHLLSIFKLLNITFCAKPCFSRHLRGSVQVESLLFSLMPER